MTKNTGKPSEKLFEESLDRLGKRAAYFRLVDASEITGRTGKIARSARAQPSDYIVTLDGVSFLAEVKSTWHETAFQFSLIKPAQWAAGVITTAAGGPYWIFVHSLVSNQWYKIPFPMIQFTKAGKKSSIKWDDLSPYLWTPK